MAIRRPLTQVIDDVTGSVWTEEFPFITSSGLDDGFDIGGVLRVNPDRSIDLGDNFKIAAGGDLDAGSRRIKGLAAPMHNGEALVFGQDAYIPLLTSSVITLINPPSTPQSAATKAYVDAVAQGFRWHPPVDAVVDYPFAPGTAVAGFAGQRVLSRAIALPVAAGIYAFDANGVPSRAEDFADGYEFGGDVVIVKGTGSDPDRMYICTTDAGVVGTFGNAWTEFNSGTQWTFDGGLQSVGNVVSVATQGPELEVVGGQLRFAGLAHGFTIDGQATSVSATQLNSLVGGGNTTLHGHAGTHVIVQTATRLPIGTLVSVDATGVVRADLTTASRSRVIGIVLASTEGENGGPPMAVIGTSGVLEIVARMPTQNAPAAAVQAFDEVAALPVRGGTIFLGANGTPSDVLPNGARSYLVEAATVIDESFVNTGSEMVVRRTVSLNIVRLGRRP